MQLIFTLHSRSQVRYEELAESVRNVFWLEHGTVYDGISSNVGWYGSLLVVYRVFGFDLHTAKFVRFGLACVSVLALAGVLRRFFSSRNAALPLLVIGLSPTLLYFNTLQAPYGIDLQYAPIVLYLVLTLDFSPSWGETCRQLLLGVVSMIACMSYPTFLFYLPSLTLLYAHQLRHAQTELRWRVVGQCLLLLGVGFALPLALVLIYLAEPRLLLFDPAVNSGIFRGAGSLSFEPFNFVQSVKHTVRDMFYRADSYYFEVAVVDFSEYYPVVLIALVLLSSVVFTSWSSATRNSFVAAWTLVVFTGVGAHITVDPSGTSGMRRSTAVLAAVYALCVLGWHVVCYGEAWARKWKPAMAGTLLLILVHHVSALPRNYMHLPDRSRYQFGASPFFLTGRPSQSVEEYVQQAQSADLNLYCGNWTGPCRLSEIYAAVAGACLWNELSCHQLLGYDEKSGRFIPLKIELWQKHYWPH